MTAQDSGNIYSVILAAGKGTRLHSTKPKVMYEILGEPMLSYVLKAVQNVSSMCSIVTGYEAECVESFYADWGVSFIRQEEQLGTGHALQCAWGTIKASGKELCLVINGDMPLIRQDHILKLINSYSNDSALAFISMDLEDPGSYGRVVRNANDEVMAIVEAKDDKEPNSEARGEINTGVYLLRVDLIEECLFSLKNDNAQNELYITDLVAMALGKGYSIQGVNIGSEKALLGINTAHELVAIEEEAKMTIVQNWLDKGVIIRNPEQVRIGPDVQLIAGCSITGPCELYGNTKVESGVVIESHCYIRDTTIGEGAHIYSFSHMDGAQVGQGSKIGPFARLRPGAVLEEDVRVGNFVEIKKSVLKKGAKTSHLSYIGDSEIHSDVNIGAGTITCNYDGKNKHKTVIKEGAFIGSNTALVAPVTVGRKAIVGAGSTITKDVNDDHLAVSRSEQRQWKRKK